MGIEWNSVSNQFVVRGRADDSRAYYSFVRSLTRHGKRLRNIFVDIWSSFSKLMYPYLGPVERKFNFFQTMNAQQMMRAHHISDNSIQVMICDYMNNRISFLTMLNRLSTVFMTSWTDVFLTPKFMVIWMQWIAALIAGCGLGLSKILGRSATLTYGISKQIQGLAATFLAKILSMSISNLRIGHKDTDSALGNAIAPRLQRGPDLVYEVLKYFYPAPGNPRRLSFETSVVKEVWNHHFTVLNPLPGRTYRGTLLAGNTVFYTPPSGNILISEQSPGGFPLPAMGQASIMLPPNYPGTTGNFARNFNRVARSTLQLVVVALIIQVFLWGVFGSSLW